MTDKEALKWCRMFSDNVFDCMEEKWDERYWDAIKAMQKCVVALEKQIPKKPEKQYNPPYENPADDEPWYLCPFCSNANIMYPEHHCECGQRLDWSEFRYPEKELEKWKKKPSIEEFVGLEGYK